LKIFETLQVVTLLHVSVNTRELEGRPTLNLFNVISSTCNLTLIVPELFGAVSVIDTRIKPGMFDSLILSSTSKLKLPFSPNVSFLQL